MDTKTGAINKFYINKFEIDHKDNLRYKVTYNKSLLPGSHLVKQYIPILSDFCLAEYYVLKDTANIIEFDMIYSSPPANPTFIINQKFLISMANWERRNTWNIYARILEVNYICQVITWRFRLKAKTW